MSADAMCTASAPLIGCRSAISAANSMHPLACTTKNCSCSVKCRCTFGRSWRRAARLSPRRAASAPVAILRSRKRLRTCKVADDHLRGWTVRQSRFGRNPAPPTLPVPWCTAEPRQKCRRSTCSMVRSPAASGSPSRSLRLRTQGTGLAHPTRSRSSASLRRSPSPPAAAGTQPFGREGRTRVPGPLQASVLDCSQEIPMDDYTRQGAARTCSTPVGGSMVYAAGRNTCNPSPSAARHCDSSSLTKRNASASVARRLARRAAASCTLSAPRSR